MKKLLAIDDEIFILRCLQKTLGAKGYDLQFTDDPDEGIRRLKEDKDIALALLDVKMPKKNGLQIYKEVLQERKIPVLFVTAYPRQFDAAQPDMVQLWQNEFAEGMTDIIYKPFQLQDLYDKVEGLIGSPTEDDEAVDDEDGMNNNDGGDGE